MSVDSYTAPNGEASIERRVSALIARMSRAEKIGQMCQRDGSGGYAPDYLREPLRAGGIGSLLNVVDISVVNELQRIAVEESRLGIPLMIGRDVIHGFRTVMPIPLGLAASWSREMVRETARVAAFEASRAGVNWTFAPMLDIARDPRWGRIAESLGEDPHLTSALAVAMIEGFQGERLADPGRIAACAKHFAGYGAAESGRDYATANIPENELRNVYLRPFKAAVEAGVATLMPAFSDNDGIPSTGNRSLLRDVLREEWGFDGLVISDWDAVPQLATHGFTGSDQDSAYQAVSAGVDMEMASDTYARHLESLVDSGEIEEELIDRAVANILRIKFRLGLFENPYNEVNSVPAISDQQMLATAKRAALQSVVLLKNERATLPLSPDSLRSIALIGPLTHAPRDQLGTWIFDGDPQRSVTPLEAIRHLVGEQVEVKFLSALENSRSLERSEFDDAAALADSSDATILFLGEEWILSGEARSRADIDLPGAQVELVRRVRESGKPLVTVILAGRPLTLSNIVDQVDAILYAWHPGCMGGPAIADLLFGVESPSGKLPATFPRMVGQIPIYCSQKSSGRPPSPDTIVHMNDIIPDDPQHSTGMTAFHIDAGYTPLFPFGHGLSYTLFEYHNIRLSESEIRLGDSLTVSAELTNRGAMAAEEVVQLYLRDLVGSVTRPVKELKEFKRVHLAPGERCTVEFTLHTEALAFYDRHMRLNTEPGDFHLWIGGSSEAGLWAQFRVIRE